MIAESVAGKTSPRISTALNPGERTNSATDDHTPDRKASTVTEDTKCLEPISTRKSDWSKLHKLQYISREYW